MVDAMIVDDAAADDTLGDLSFLDDADDIVDAPETGKEADEAPSDDVFGALQEGTKGADAAVAHVTEAVTKLLDLKGAIEALGAANATAMTTILAVLRDEVRPLKEEVEALRSQISLVLGILDMPDEQKAWLLSLAAQGATSMGDVIGGIVGQHMSWNPEDFLTLFKGDLAKNVRGHADGRSTTPDAVAIAAVQFAWDQRSL
jgi:hypothetical protein